MDGIDMIEIPYLYMLTHIHVECELFGDDLLL